MYQQICSFSHNIDISFVTKSPFILFMSIKLFSDIRRILKAEHNLQKWTTINDNTSDV